MSVSVCPCRIIANNINVIEEQLTLKSYSECCEPLHNKVAAADSAEALMRSRYAAFVLQKVDYIVETTLPAQQIFLDKEAIAEWAEETDWAGLEVTQHVPKLGKRHAQVEFKAYYRTLDGEMGAHHERSAFVRAKPHLEATAACWYFLDPTVGLKVTQKQPCVCGSKEKFKRCCGQYI